MEEWKNGEKERIPKEARLSRKRESAKARKRSYIFRVSSILTTFYPKGIEGQRFQAVSEGLRL
jgi:hypothetical protein